MQTDSTLYGSHALVASRLRQSADLMLACAFVVVGVVAVGLVPDGSVLRFILVAPVLFVVPGYLLIQACVVKESKRRSRLTHVLLAVGVTPPVLGLIALATALVPGGFRLAFIAAAVAVACFGMAALADYRRTQHALARVQRAEVRGRARAASPSLAPAVAEASPPQGTQ